MLPYRYTQTEQKELLNSINILIDTREQKINHITNYFKKKNISYNDRKLNYGDYSFYLPKNEKLGIVRDIYFNDRICIERKHTLDELSNNLTHNRTQFENELIRSNNGKMFLLVEVENGYENIIKHNYKTKYKPKSYIASLHAFKHRYNLDIAFVNKKLSGNYIFYTFYYWLREFLK